jgi:hypothetical protein
MHCSRAEGAHKYWASAALVVSQLIVSGTGAAAQCRKVAGAEGPELPELGQTSPNLMVWMPFFIATI